MSRTKQGGRGSRIASALACVVLAACGSSDRHRQVIPDLDSGADVATPPPVPDAAVDSHRPALPEAASPEAAPPPVDAGPEAGPVFNGVFVEPTAGLDTNTGERATPFKTIAHAVTVAKAGQTIYLEPGTYDASNQGSLQFTIPAGVRVEGLAKTGVTLVSTLAANENAMVWGGGGGIKNVDFHDFATAVTVHGTGTFDASNVHFSGVGRPFFFSDDIQATVDATDATPIFSNVPVDNSIGMVGIELNAELVFTGGDISNIPTTGVAVFFARGKAKLTLSGTTIDTVARRALVLYDDTVTVLKDVTIRNVSWTSSGIENSVIYTGGMQQTPTAPSLSLVNTSVVNNGITAIGMVVQNLGYHPSITFSNSHLDDNTGRGLRIEAYSQPVGENIDIQATNSTFDRNTLEGISASHLNLKMTGGEISGNGDVGLSTVDTASKSTVALSGVAFDGNTRDAISFAGGAGSTFDLGTKAAPGNVVFTNVAVSPRAAVVLAGPIAGTAVGDTWVPNVQGANAQGKFTVATTIPVNAVGNNFTLSGGATLVVAQ